jgi:hypothetical protein
MKGRAKKLRQDMLIIYNIIKIMIIINDAQTERILS